MSTSEHCHCEAGLSQDVKDIVQLFRSFLARNIALPVAAMNALVARIKISRATTWMQLEQELRETINALQNCTHDDLSGRTNISLGSGCDLFMKYVTRTFNLEMKDFESCKAELLRRGERFANMSMSARTQIAEVGHSFIQEGNTVLIHGQSRVVTALILKAAETVDFNLIVTEAKPGRIGVEQAQSFAAAGIPTKLITDSAVGVFMEEVDLCLVGAEGVMENGGIINKIGTYQIALVAHALNKPFYVAVESYKFARMYPLSQRDTRKLSTPIKEDAASKLTKTFSTLMIDDFSATASQTRSATSNSTSSQASSVNVAEVSSNLTIDLPTVDFTPAKLITLLFTDLGVLTPAAVSDELIKLYQ